MGWMYNWMRWWLESWAGRCVEVHKTRDILSYLSQNWLLLLYETLQALHFIQQLGLGHKHHHLRWVVWHCCSSPTFPELPAVLSSSTRDLSKDKDKDKTMNTWAMKPTLLPLPVPCLHLQQALHFFPHH